MRSRRALRSELSLSPKTSAGRSLSSASARQPLLTQAVMSDWAGRRAEIDGLVPELSSLYPALSLPVELLDTALLHATKPSQSTLCPDHRTEH